MLQGLHRIGRRNTILLCIRPCLWDCRRSDSTIMNSWRNESIRDYECSESTNNCNMSALTERCVIFVFTYGQKKHLIVWIASGTTRNEQCKDMNYYRFLKSNSSQNHILISKLAWFSPILRLKSQIRQFYSVFNLNVTFFCWSAIIRSNQKYFESVGQLQWIGRSAEKKHLIYK